VSIERRWCESCRSWHYFAILRRRSAKSWWSKKAREVVALFILGEIIAVGTLGLAAGALAAMR